MSSIRARERAAAWFFAIIFIVSTCALTVVIIISNIQSSKQQDPGASSQQSTKQGENKNMLQGTKLENFTPVAEVSELQKTDTKVGTGAEVTSVNQTPTMDYTGAVAATGTIFQSSIDAGKPLSGYPLSGLIKGWQEGVIGMKVGGTRRLVIPAEKAYGANPPANSGIPANAALVFDMTLIDVK